MIESCNANASPAVALSAERDTAGLLHNRALGKYEKPDLGKASWQLVNTFVPYAALWVWMVWMIRRGVSYWELAPPVLVAAGLLVRIFIIFHDCCHGSFFASRRANQLLGYAAGILTFTPFEGWQHSHNRHHASAGDLDRRGIGDVWTMTLDEFRAASRWKQWGYRFFRNPLVLFFLVPPALFLIAQRFPRRGANSREFRSVLLTDLGIAILVFIASLTIGLRTYLLIQLPIMLVTGTVGVWLFYVQHQFKGVYWARHADWDPLRAAMEGSSYYRLPGWLQWFTGSIGLHHIHHLRSRIPNYNLQRCFDEVPALRAVPVLTPLGSINCLWLNLYDESSRKLISFRSLGRNTHGTA